MKIRNEEVADETTTGRCVSCTYCVIFKILFS